MAIDPIQLVRDQFTPILSQSDWLADAIPRQVEAQTALQGLIPGALTDGQKVYIATLTAFALIPPLLLELAGKVQKAKGGTSEVEYREAQEYLELLQKQLKEQVKMAAKEVAPEDVEDTGRKPSPYAGVESW